jgi:hypothetical protein
MTYYVTMSMQYVSTLQFVAMIIRDCVLAMISLALMNLIYIYIYREREREREKWLTELINSTDLVMFHPVCAACK